MNAIKNTDKFQKYNETGYVRLYSKKPGKFYRVQEGYFSSASSGVLSESHLSPREYLYNADDWFMPSGYHWNINGNKYYPGDFYSTVDNGDDYPARMLGWVILINPDENDWTLEPSVSDLQKTTDRIKMMLDNDLLTFRNLLFAVDKISKIVDNEISSYSSIQEYENQLKINRTRILSKIDSDILHSISECFNTVYQLNSLYEIQIYGFKNREYTTIPELKPKYRSFHQFGAYIYQILFSKPINEFYYKEFPLIYKLDFEHNYVLIIYEYLGRFVTTSTENLELSKQILKRLDINNVETGKGESENNNDYPDTESPEDDQPPTEQPATETKKETSGGTLVKLLSFGYLISKFIR